MLNKYFYANMRNNKRKVFAITYWKPKDCSNFVNSLCSTNGIWINGQLLYSDDGWAQ